MITQNDSPININLPLECMGSLTPTSWLMALGPRRPRRPRRRRGDRMILADEGRRTEHNWYSRSLIVAQWLVTAPPVPGDMASIMRPTNVGKIHNAGIKPLYEKNEVSVLAVTTV